MESQSPYRSVFPSYSENSLLKPRNFYETGLEESLENIILNEKPEQERGIVDKVFTNKSRTLKATIKALFNEILTRERLSSHILRKVEDEICKTDTYLEEIRGIASRDYTLQATKDFSGRRTRLESRLIDLEKIKIEEYLACFKDISLTSRYILSALKDYWNISNRKSFLNVENDEFGYRSNLPEIETYSKE